MGGDVVVFAVGEFFIVNVLYNIFGGGESDGILIKINIECLVIFGDSESDEILFREIDYCFVEYVIYLGMENLDFIESIDFDVAGNIYIVNNNNFFNIVVSKIFNDG